ncbi:hypothetical protein DB30_01672 [Enhygromyxa salina]|uniref:Ribosome maturation factor RimP n=1 Tax=Enhygromyxa salina TaxID=215803 RepID=A0A0C2A450_9BACT|nr:ribosome maturation factor RimP [Enhygromyxa salina]KIG18168.1 hypothetical protein DB30_01672 [Enhygromyxa salina]
MTPAHDTHDASRSPADPSRPQDRDAEQDSGREHGRHAAAVTLVEQAIEPAIEDMGYELLLLEWATSGKRRILRVFLDHPDGVSVGDCSRMSRIIGNTLDASDPTSGPVGDDDGATKVDPSLVNPALAALLSRPYSLEVSSPGVDRPLTRLRHFAAHIGGRVKVETWEPFNPDDSGGGSASGQTAEQRKFHGRIAAVEPDPTAPDHQRRGVVVIQDADRPRELRIPLPRIRRANLVWEG